MLVLLLIATHSARTAHGQNEGAVFEPGECVFTNNPFENQTDPENDQSPFTVLCGTVAVPAHYADPSNNDPIGPTIQLAVVVFQNQAANAAPDPLFLLQGGPGGSTIETYARLVKQTSFSALNRDIVLFDQRGTLHSRPALTCTDEEIALVEATIEREISDAEEERLFQEAFSACIDRLTAAGVDLSAFNSLNNAADIESLRLALGYDQINIYGVSYGTLLALHHMRDFPQHIRSVILDAVVPTQTAFLAEIARSADRSFDELFAACAADAQCQSAFPTLEKDFYTLVGEWNTQPVRVRVTDPETGRTYSAVYDGGALINMLFGSLYSKETFPALPLAIDNARRGNYDYLSSNLATRTFERNFASAMYATVICPEDVNADLTLIDDGEIHPELLAEEAQGLESIRAECARLALPPLGPRANEPVVSQIPTLIFNGQFDPITPPWFGELAATTLPNSFLFTFPGNGHGAALGECADSLIARFLRRPTQRPESSCIDDVEPLRFVTPEMVLQTPFTNQVLFALNKIFEGESAWRSFPQLLALIGSTLFLFTIWIVWPIAALSSRRRLRPVSAGEAHPNARVIHPHYRLIPDPALDSPPSRAGSAAKVGERGLRWAVWTAFIAGPLALIVLIGLIVLIFYTFLAHPDLIFVGVPRATAPFFVLPLLSALVTLFMLVASLLCWRKKNYWSLWRRCYYALLTVAACTFVGTLFNFGLITVLFQ